MSRDALFRPGPVGKSQQCPILKRVASEIGTRSCNALARVTQSVRGKTCIAASSIETPTGARSGTDGFERVGSRILDFLRSRSADHWIMFFAGIVIGMIIG